MKTVLFVIAGVLTAGGASWFALPALQNEAPQVPAVVSPVKCHGTAEACHQASNCNGDQLYCDSKCANCPDVKDEDGDGRCDVEKDCERHSINCASTHRTASCHDDEVICPGTNCGDCKEFEDADGDGACDKIGDCKGHTSVKCSRNGGNGHRGRGCCHVPARQPEASK